MPYIYQGDRYRYNDPLVPRNAGELNFAITMLCIKYLREQEKSYTTINEVMGVLTCAQQEFYRRVAAPYEDRKMQENGDVYL